ncbi:hypothetical protein [Pseudomonas sp. GTC 16482]|uniref:hypothetical protein n=1 Tax=Pseudomonas sp. GTC 16482 TaxID=1661693 RepID=UPI0007613914|nr:hypothetical protein [Pseudomonas sp. GTC 16482]
MSKEKFTMRYIAWQVVTGLIDPDMYAEAWTAAKQLGYVLLAVVVRATMLATFPVSVPFLWASFRVMEPINQKRRKIRHEKIIADLRRRQEDE